MNRTFIFGRTAHEALRQLAPAHVRHHDVGDHQVDVVGVTLGHAQRIHAVPRLEHDVAVTAQHLARERSHGVLVLDQQHRFPRLLPEVAAAAAIAAPAPTVTPPAAGTP